MNTVYDITVTEKSIVVKDSIDESLKTVPEFIITVKTSQYKLYVIRYIPDLFSFDHLVRTHYPKIKIPFPSLTESLSKSEKRKSIRNFFHLSIKSNAEKVEKYLYRCTLDPVLSASTLLRDFLSPQRDGDEKSHAYPSPSQSYDQIGSTPNDNVIDSSIEIGKVWVPSPHPSVISLSNSVHSRRSSHRSSISRHSSISRRNSMSRQQNSSRSISIVRRTSFGRRSSISRNRHLSHCSNPSHHSNDSHHSNVSGHLNNLESYVQEEEESDEEDLMNILPKENVDINGFEYESPLENLEMIKVLGKGCMGKVLLVRSRKTEELYALKSIIKEHVIEQREITHTLDERNILTKLSELDHPYLAKLHTSFQDEHRLYLLTNYYCGGDLATHMAKLYSFPKECALFYAAEIIDGIGALHSLGILYRDLKPENILLTGDGHIILTDFGLSKWLNASDNYTTQTFCGTAEYLAPEVLLGDSYSFGIDHWSFGTILYEMLAGITPFWADNHADMYRRVLEDPLEFPADIFDYETAEFISDILDRDPRTRLGAQSVDDIKDHVYFADISWDDIRNRRLHPPYLPPVQNEMDFTNFDPDFLAMTPQLTPISSEIDFVEDIQDIFDGYSFTNEKYLDYEQLSRRMYSRQSHHEDGFYQPQLQEDEEDAQTPPLFQPARKRGSLSMLSNVDSFFLDDEVIKPNSARDPTVEVTFKNEEIARYAKRRNTSASEDHTTLPVEQHTTVEEFTTSDYKKMNNNTLVVINNNNAIPDTFEDLEFSKLPDLRLSFNIDREPIPNKGTPPSNKSSHQSKTRRFFSLLL